jgi:hypothetical protein
VHFKITFSFFILLISNIVFASNTDWMSQIPNDRILNQIIIPGTHDSGSFGITKNSLFSLSKDNPLPIWVELISNIFPHSIVRAISAGWSKTQPNSITQQLNDGIRYLDLRVCLYQSHFYLCHAQLSLRLNKALKQIHSFAKNNPSEIILVDINHVNGITNSIQENNLVILIQHYLGADAIPNTYHVTDSIGTLRASKHNVIIFMDSQNNIANSFWPESNIHSPWPNVSNIADLKDTLNSEVAFRAKTAASSHHLFVLQVIETENDNQVIDGILYPRLFAHDIRQLELPVNESLYTWISNYIAQYGIGSINIVIQDWYTHHNDLVSAAIKYDSQTLPIIPHPISKQKIQALKEWLYTQVKQ